MKMLLTGMFAREAADPRCAVGQVTGGGGVVQTLQIVGGTEDWGDTAATIGTVTSRLVAVPVVREAVVRVGRVSGYNVVDSLSLALTRPRQQEEGGH